jgi:hypothetical protein
MDLSKLHRFYLSYKIDGKIHLSWIEALNLRHAKEKILFKDENATDIRDWTNEGKEELERYIDKNGKPVIISQTVL